MTRGRVQCPAARPRTDPRLPPLSREDLGAHHLEINLGVDPQASRKDVRGHDIALRAHHPTHHDVGEELCLHHPGNIRVVNGDPPVVLTVVSLVLVKNFLITEEPHHVLLLGMLQLVHHFH